MTFKSTRKSLKKVTKKISTTAKKISKPVLSKVSSALARKGKNKVTGGSKKADRVADKITSAKSNTVSAGQVNLNKKVKTILVAQPKPENDKNPYSDIAARQGVTIQFKPFIYLEGVSLREFRRYKVNPLDYTAIIFTSKNAIDHFFKLCEDLKIKMPQEIKYYCMTESIALYLQKYILYRKRKVFYGDNTLKGLTNEIVRHRDNEKYLLPCSDIHKPDIADFLKAQKYEYAEVVILRTVPVELKKADINYDMLVFFTPAGVNSLVHNFPSFKQKDLIICAFGPQTAQAIQDAKLRLDLQAPVPEAPSMSMAIEQYLIRFKKK